MPENQNHPNTEQIKRNIEAFRERLKNRIERFKFASIEDVPQEKPQIEIKVEQPVAAEQSPKILENEWGRPYPAHIGWGRSTMENGGTI